jgi:hypothetical protein
MLQSTVTRTAPSSGATTPVFPNRMSLPLLPSFPPTREPLAASLLPTVDEWILDHPNDLGRDLRPHSKAVTHPYARMHSKKQTEKQKRRKVWNHALEKDIFTSNELYALLLATHVAYPPHHELAALL